MLYILLYVNDNILISKNNIALFKLITKLANSFKMKDMCLLPHFLGIKVK